MTLQGHQQGAEVLRVVLRAGCHLLAGRRPLQTVQTTLLRTTEVIWGCHSGDTSTWVYLLIHLSLY